MDAILDCFRRVVNLKSEKISNLRVAIRALSKTLAWHARPPGDPGQRRLRELQVEVCKALVQACGHCG
jgi:hypothetical protein